VVSCPSQRCRGPPCACGTKPRRGRPGYRTGWPICMCKISREDSMDSIQQLFPLWLFLVKPSCTRGKAARTTKRPVTRSNNLASSLAVAPTEVKCEFLKSSFFVVAVFLSSNMVVIRTNMHQEATRTPHMNPWGWGEGRKNIFSFPNILRNNISI
jgi:hypothetical protein